MVGKDISLGNLTDKQKTLLSQFSYIDVDMDKYEKLKITDKNITISDLEAILSNPDEPYVGNASMAVNATVGTLSTEKELLQELQKEGLGDLKVTDIVKNSKTGFSGIAFQDSNNTTGISYTGTDLNTFIQDCLTDAQEYIMDTSSQAEQAKQFYDENKNTSGNNYLYGHSLGGNLAQHVYLEDHDNINSTFTINAYPINQDLLNTEDKINAFNDSEKFQCNVIGGDWVSELRDTSKYSDNINYIKNNNALKDNIISDHLPEMATYDENGNFVKTKTKSEAYKGHEHNFQRIVPKGLSATGNVVKNIYSGAKKLFNGFKDLIKSSFFSIGNKLSSDNKALPEGKNTLNFRECLNVINWAEEHDNYTLSAAENAIEVSNNPFKYITTQKEQQERLIPEHNEEDFWPSHEHSHNHLHH